MAFAFACVVGTTGIASADQASDLAAKMEAMQQQMDAMKAQLDELKAARRLAPPPGTPPARPGQGGPFIQRVPGDPVTFLVGGEAITVYGNLDLSIDSTTKGFEHSPIPADGPVGNTSYLNAVSSNLSYIGVRGRHKLGPNSGLLYQLETQLDVSSTAGTVNTNSNNDSVVKGALTSRNSFVGLATKIGAFKLGKSDAPYKNATARMNPFTAELGDYAVIMGNSGGDNRVEFGTRLDHAIWYESPALHGWTFNLLASPGQNRSSDSSNIAAGESSCAGGNVPGSGALPPGCNDGAFSNAYSGNVAYQMGKWYATYAYELHQRVNRSSDIADPVLSPLDIADERAWKAGVQYAFSPRSTISLIYEDLKRYVDPSLEFQNERTRNGFWTAFSQGLSNSDSINFGWARANPSPGDTGQHNTPGGPNPDNMANLYTIAYKHAIDKHVSWYADWALTLNHPDAHYDLGAGGRGITTDCHDAATLTAFDPTAAPVPVSGTGPHCFAGGRLQGFSAGLKVQF